MLILTRKENQKIVISEEIVITICKVSGGRVRVGIDAPDEMNIRRGELNLSPAEARLLTVPAK